MLKTKKVGWTAGVGIEHVFSPHWTACAEFRYVDFGKTNIACASAKDFAGCVSLGYRGDFSNTLKLGLVGLAYRFQLDCILSSLPRWSRLRVEAFRDDRLSQASKAGQSYVCAVMAGLVPVIHVLPIRRH